MNPQFDYAQASENPAFIHICDMKSIRLLYIPLEFLLAHARNLFILVIDIKKNKLNIRNKVIRIYIDLFSTIHHPLMQIDGQ